MSDTLPLVTIGLKSYNQRSYLKAALSGVLAQTYRPLEIIISDDGSSDGSWEMISEQISAFEASAASEGCRVILNRNESNLGNLGNWEKIGKLAHGELIVKADGDDISLPNRVSRIVAVWMANGCRATVIAHSAFRIGPKGERLGRLSLPNPDYPVGAVMAFSRHVFSVFPPAEDARTVDDEIYTSRALLLGDWLSFPEPLVLYRLGTGISNELWGMREALAGGRRNLLVAFRQARHDLEIIQNKLDDKEQTRRIAEINRREKIATAEYELFAGKSFLGRFRSYRQLGIGQGVMAFLRFAALWPRPVSNMLYFIYSVIKYVLRRFAFA